MATQEPISDITTRDVLQQVDRRLELLEGDVRALDAKVDSGFSELRSYVDSGFSELRSYVDSGFSELRGHIDTGLGEQRSYVDSGFGQLRRSIDETRDRLENRMDVRFRWTVGLILMSWMTTMGAILFRLGPALH
jgi:hypothetical protein